MDPVDLVALLQLVDAEPPACPHARVRALPMQQDGSVYGRCEDCGDESFVIAEPPDAMHVVVLREQVEAALADVERAMEHWPRLKPLYMGEQTEATSALTEIGCCVGDALHRLQALLVLLEDG